MDRDNENPRKEIGEIDFIKDSRFYIFIHFVFIYFFFIEICENFLKNFVDENNVKKYVLLLDNIAQYKQSVLRIELDDLLVVFFFVVVFFLFKVYNLV
jgi:hypothetical protein